MFFKTNKQTCLDGMEPEDLGFDPVHFPTFRPIQLPLVDFAVYGPSGDGVSKPYQMHCAPPGSGKTLAIEAAATMLRRMTRNGKGRSITITPTKSLQDQRVAEIPNMADIRGRNNYHCTGVRMNLIDKDGRDIKEEDVDCDMGAKNGCVHDGSNKCEYKRFFDIASNAPSVSSNPSFWMNVRRHNPAALEGAGPFDILMVDECHLMFKAITSFLSTYLPLNKICQFGKIKPSAAPWAVGQNAAFEHGRIDMDWYNLLCEVYNNAQAEAHRILHELYEGRIKEALEDEDYREVDEFAKSVGKIAKHGKDGNWIWQIKGKHGVVFDCIWPYKYVQQYLFQNVPVVQLYSATARPKLASLLGISKNDYHYMEWPRQFPAERGPVYWLKTGVKLSKEKNTPEDWRTIVRWFDALVEARMGTRTLVHTVSYDRALDLQRDSKFGRYMHLNRPEAGYRSAKQTAERYRKADPSKEPVILAGPSFTTGWDFPLDACRLNILLKVPFSNPNDPIALARRDDKEFANYEVMQEVVQACGRPTRTELDWAETFILDDTIGTFRHYAKFHAPSYFFIKEIEHVPVRPKFD